MLFIALGFVSLNGDNIDGDHLDKGCLKLSCDYVGEVYLKEHHQRLYKKIGDCRIRFKNFYFEPNTYDLKVIATYNKKNWVYQEDNILLEKPLVIRPKKRIEVVINSDLTEKVATNETKIVTKCKEIIVYKRKNFKPFDNKVFQLDKRFVAMDGFVQDKELGILWQDTIDNKSKKVTYNQAKQYCEKSNGRLPTKDEIHSLTISNLFDFNGKNKLSQNKLDIFVNIPAKRDYWIEAKEYANGDKDYFIYNHDTDIIKKALSFEKHYIRCVIDE